MRQFIIFFLLFNSCTTNNKVFENELKKESCIESVLANIDYQARKIQLTDSLLYIIGDTTFSDGLEANNTLLNYLEYKIFENNNKCGYSKIVIKYNKTEYITTLSSSNVLKKNDRYWSFLEQALKNIDIHDCVYYDLTSEMIKEATHFNFNGDIWKLIAKLSEEDKNAHDSFLAFYNWSNVKYSDELEFDRTKLNWFIAELGYNSQEINDSFIDSLYRQREYSSFFK